MTRTHRTLVLVAGLGFLAVGAGCASPAPAESSPGASASAESLEGTITVFAAASLTSTFTDLAAAFEEENPGTTVELNFAGSSNLVTQIIEGAPADVFASADTNNMTKLTDAELNGAELNDGNPVDFATNVLEIAVPPGNPAGIRVLPDLAGPDVRLVTCAPEVPCGRATETIETATGVMLTPVSEESSVTDVLGKVTSGEADAGLVYVTDVIAAGDAVEGIEFDETSEAVNTYPIVALRGSEAADVAHAFVDYITGSAGQGVLRAAGFGAP